MLRFNNICKLALFIILTMLIKFNLFFLLFSIINSQNSSNYNSIIKWVSSNFGSAFSSLPLFYDFNHDGSVDIMVLSVDGEIICYDIATGESLHSSNWPVYISNDHFFAKPIMFIHGQNYNQEIILIISQKGLIYYFDWKGLLLNTIKLDNVYLHQNWSFINYQSIKEVLVPAHYISNGSLYELHPEVYTDATILDLSVTGISGDLVIPVNFVSKNLGNKDVILSAVIVFNLISKSIVTLHPLKISMKNSESPEYLLTNIDVLDSGVYHLIATSTAGIIYKLRWDRKRNQFDSLFSDDLVYNIGPNKCQLTEFCRNSKNYFIKNGLCCIYIDYYGHMVMLDLHKPGSMWEYEFKDAGTATEVEIFINNSTVKPDVLAIFATNNGWIHCVSLMTGIAIPSFPIVFKNETFHSNSQILIDSHSNVLMIILSNKGNLYEIPIDNPKNWKILIHNNQLSSYLPPIIVQSTSKMFQTEIIIQSKNGFIFKYDINGMKPLENRFAKAEINHNNRGLISTLYGFGSSFSFDLVIQDLAHNVFDSTGYYTVKVFVNEFLYSTFKELKTGEKLKYSRLLVDMKTLDQNLISPSVFLFGTVTIKVTDHLGQAFPVDYFFIRINYDFQFELIWIVYLTFSICLLSILILHFYNDNHKFHIPIYKDFVIIKNEE